MKPAERYEYATSRDPSLNYCLWQRSPAVSVEGKFRSVNLLFHSLDHAGVNARAFAIVDAIREAIGPFRTVFGVKLLPDKLAWELYFYDYQTRQREVSVSRVLDAIRPLVGCRVRVNENLPYFMFSLDLDAELAGGGRDIDVVHLYLGSPGSTVCSGIAYAVRATGTMRENFYFFFDAAQVGLRTPPGKSALRRTSMIRTCRWKRSLFRSCARARRSVWPTMQTQDCVYFSGVDVRQLLFFLTRMEYPEAIVSFARQNLAKLDHLRFDVGFDYRMEGGALSILKSGYYGVF